MALTFQEVCEELNKLDETTLLEILEITTEELVDKFQDKIEDNLDELTKVVEDNREDMINYEE
jgi:hypothetical protein